MSRDCPIQLVDHWNHSHLIRHRFIKVPNNVEHWAVQKAPTLTVRTTLGHGYAASCVTQHTHNTHTQPQRTDTFIIRDSTAEASSRSVEIDPRNRRAKNAPIHLQVKGPWLDYSFRLTNYILQLGAQNLVGAGSGKAKSHPAAQANPSILLAFSGGRSIPRLRTIAKLWTPLMAFMEGLQLALRLARLSEVPKLLTARSDRATGETPSRIASCPETSA